MADNSNVSMEMRAWDAAGIRGDRGALNAGWLSPRLRRGVSLISFLAAALLCSCTRDARPDEILLNGRIEATTVDLAPKVAGRVVEVAVGEGDRVAAGALLVKLDLGDTALAPARDAYGAASAEARLRDFESGSRAPEIDAAEAEVEDRRAAVDLANRELERQTRLLDEEIASRQEFDAAKTAADRARAALVSSEERLELLREGSRRWQTAQARSDLDRARTVLRQSEVLAGESEIRAPADGVILHRIAEPGLLLVPGQPALTFAFANRLYVRTFIPEPQLGRIRQGMTATVRVDAFPGRDFPAHVGEISPEAEFTPKAVETRTERVNLVYAAKVDLDAGWKEPIVPGQPAEVTVAPGAAP